MKVTVRLLGAIWISALLIMGGFAFLQVREERQRLASDLERRAALLGEGLKESVEPAVRRGATPRVAGLLKKFARPDRRIVVYDAFGSPVAAAPTAVPTLPTPVPEVTEAITRGTAIMGLRTIDGTPVYVYATPLHAEDRTTSILAVDRTTGALAVFLDGAHLEAAEKALWRSNAVRFFALVLGLSLITLLIVRMTITRPMSEIAEWAKTLKGGKPAPLPDLPDTRLFGPLALEVTGLARSLYRARAAAEQEAALRLSGEAIWTEERLKQFVRLRVGERPMYVVSNREPLSHVWKAGRIVSQTPASGVVTAMEPVMRACGGIWVASASGDADRETADAHDRLGLPPDDPRYTLRRVWLTPEE